MAQDVVRRHVVVTGRVQGVFFRDSMRQLAEDRGIAGWVSNRADGALEAVFEGSEANVIELLTFCREGPPQARVETVTANQEQPEGLSGFSVR